MSFKAITWLQLARELSGLSQGELADHAGLSQGQISHYETGRRVPRAATVRRLADALGVRADRLFATDGPSVEEWVGTYLAPSDEATSWAIAHLNEPESDQEPRFQLDPDDDPDVQPAPDHLRSAAADFVVDFERDAVTSVDGQGRALWTDYFDGRRVIHVPAGARVSVVVQRTTPRRTPGRANRPGARRTRRTGSSASSDSADGPGEPPAHRRRA